MNISIKRAYEPANNDDGMRILVDRLWPRGLSKEKAKIDLWLKEIAPSTELRKWFNHDPAKWSEFQEKYRRELADNPSAVQQILDLAKHKITLIQSAKDETHNDAVVLKQYLEEQLTSR